VARAEACGLLNGTSRCAIDATGLETRHVSRHYVWRSNLKRYGMRKWPKLTGVFDIDSHLVIAMHRCMGPCQDSPQFAPAIRDAARRRTITAVLADKGYDAEHNHALCREELGIRSTIIAVRRNTNGTREWPKTPYRRAMKRRKNIEGYGQRWQAESAFSAHKRLLGSALRARTWLMQQAEMAVRVLTHNCMIIANAS
jgi:transposase